jgi:nitrile hydratase
METDQPEHAHGHEIGHERHHSHAAHPTREDDDLALTYAEAKFLALRGMLIEKGVLTADEIRRRLEANDRGTPHQGARMVAKAWVDPSFKARMLADGKAAALELGIEVTEAELMVIENTATCHNLIVCTLCSCYPRSLLGEPPAWYVSKAYRSRAVREPRKVLREFGLDFPDSIEIRVHDSNADLRYIVLPMRPQGTDGLSEPELAKLISRDCLVGTAVPGRGDGNGGQTTEVSGPRQDYS